MLLVVSLGLLAAFLFAAAASLQQHAAARAGYAPQTERGRYGLERSVLRPLLELVRTLVHNRLWLAGWLTNLVGFLVQATALHEGSVALVQPLLVTQLIFALPLASAWTGSWPSARAWVSALTICSGLVIFLAVPGAAPLQGSPDRQKVIVAGISALIAVSLLMVASIGRPQLVHATLLAVAAGLCFAMSAVLMKLTAHDLLANGVAATATDWVGYSLAVSTVAGLLLEQGAFAAGSLPAAIAAMAITNPLVSYLIGVLAFQARLPATPSAWAAVIGAGVLVFAGVFGLAHSSAIRPDTRIGSGNKTSRGAATARSR